MFHVTTLDLGKIPVVEGKVDFDKDFFGKEANLTVSGQLSVETFCLSLGKVYTFGPTFRSENSNTSRHIAEFWMIEPEIAFADFSDNMALGQELILGYPSAINADIHAGETLSRHHSSIRQQKGAQHGQFAERDLCQMAKPVEYRLVARRIRPSR